MKKSEEKFYNKLITAVEHEKGLYVKENPIYMSRFRQEIVWARISLVTGRKKAECKKRWRLLRTKFVRLYNRQMRSGSSDSGFDLDCWPFYKQMMFLKDHIEKRPDCCSDTVESISTLHCDILDETSYLEIDLLNTNDTLMPTSSEAEPDTKFFSETTESTYVLKDSSTQTSNSDYDSFFNYLESLAAPLNEKVKICLKNTFINMTIDELKMANIN